MLQLYLNHTFALLFSGKSAVCLQNTLFQEHLWVTACENTYGPRHSVSALLKPCGSQDILFLLSRELKIE